MKKILFATSLLLSLSCLSQAKQDTAKVEKVFYLLLPEKGWQELIELIKTVDEKPSKVNGWIQTLITNLRLYEPQKEEKKK